MPRNNWDFLEDRAYNFDMDTQQIARDGYGMTAAESDQFADHNFTDRLFDPTELGTVDDEDPSRQPMSRWLKRSDVFFHASSDRDTAHYDRPMHMGTVGAAEVRRGDSHMHALRVPGYKVADNNDYPVSDAEANILTRSDPTHALGYIDQMDSNLQNYLDDDQLDLWEEKRKELPTSWTTPGSGEQTYKALDEVGMPYLGDEVLPYINDQEDPGSISVVAPRDLTRSYAQDIGAGGTSEVSNPGPPDWWEERNPNQEPLFRNVEVTSIENTPRGDGTFRQVKKTEPVGYAATENLLSGQFKDLRYHVGNKRDARIVMRDKDVYDVGSPEHTLVNEYLL